MTPGTPADRAPLSERLRPRTLGEFIGQRDLLREGGPVGRMVAARRLRSVIFWGPPGCGKTSLARLLGKAADAHWLELSAVSAGVADVRRAVAEMREVRDAQPGRQRALFLDEVHRFNKAQQDALLPHIEQGLFVFIGATTENPSFEVNGALLSRAPVHLMGPLGKDDLGTLAERITAACGVRFDAAARDFLVDFADGDARRAINLAEALEGTDREVGLDELRKVALERFRRLGRGGDEFYDQISALHKSVRGSDPDAALYWLCRMLDGGADPLYVSRRVIRMAVEDVGLADPRVFQVAVAADDAYRRLGSPEGELAIANAVIYAAVAPKSNAGYHAFSRMGEFVRRSGSLPVPPHLRNAPTRLMKDLGHGKGYRYAHDEEHGYSAGESYFPERMDPLRVYLPTDRGLERRIRERLEFLRGLDAKKRGGQAN